MGVWGSSTPQRFDVPNRRIHVSSATAAADGTIYFVTSSLRIFSLRQGVFHELKKPAKMPQRDDEKSGGESPGLFFDDATQTLWLGDRTYTPRSHLFFTGMGFGVGTRRGAVDYTPRLVVGRDEAGVILRLRRGISAHFYSDAIGVELADQYTGSHELRLMFFVNPLMVRWHAIEHGLSSAADRLTNPRRY